MRSSLHLSSSSPEKNNSALDLDINSKVRTEYVCSVQFLSFTYFTIVDDLTSF
jgi:hypothetical protein